MLVKDQVRTAEDSDRGERSHLATGNLPSLQGKPAERVEYLGLMDMTVREWHGEAMRPDERKVG